MNENRDQMIIVLLSIVHEYGCDIHLVHTWAQRLEESNGRGGHTHEREGKVMPNEAADRKANGKGKE